MSFSLSHLAPAAIFALCTHTICAQPFISPKSILNAASYTQPGIPGGAIARGSMFSIFGRSLGPAAPAQANAFPLGTNLQGVSIQVIQGSQSVNALPIYVSANQINAILPSNAPLGMVSLQVTFNGRSNLAPVRIAPSSPGLFTATGYGAGPGIFQNFVSSVEQPINSAANAAKPGQIVTLWGTGLGPIAAPDNIAPPVGNLTTPIQVYVGNKLASNVLYSGRAPCCAAVDQIVFEVPADTPEGCFVPVHLKAGDAVSNAVTLAVRKEGGACVDTSNALSSAHAAGKKTGLALITRIQMRVDTGVPVNRDLTGDFASAYFQQSNTVPFSYDPIIALPPQGTCSTFTAAGDLIAGTGLLRLPGRTLDAGAITVNGNRSIAVSGATLLGIGGELPGVANLPLFLDTGTVNLRAAGGADVGAFSLNLNPPAALNWTNRDALNAVDRAAPVAFRFTGAGPRSVLVGGIGADLPANASAMFLCAVPDGAESFTVPPLMLANFPASRPLLMQSPSVLFVAALSSPLELPASGLEFSSARTVHIQSKTVTFR